MESPVAAILCDGSLSATDKLLAIALRSVDVGSDGITLTNKELASLIDGAEKSISRSLQTLSQEGYIRTEIRSGYQRTIELTKRLSGGNSKQRPSDKDKKTPDIPRNNLVTPMGKSQKIDLTPLTKLLPPLPNCYGGVTKTHGGCNLQSTENVSFSLLAQSEVRKFIKKAPNNILLYIYNIQGVNLKKKGCGEKTKPKQAPYEVVKNSKDISTCKVLYEMCNEYRKLHKDVYPIEMYESFLEYWSEPNEKGEPLWYTTKKSKNGRFDLPRRLSTWHQRPSWSKKEKPADAAQGKIEQSFNVITKAGAALRELKQANSY